MYTRTQLLKREAENPSRRDFFQGGEGKQTNNRLLLLLLVRGGKA